ncbi:hypothetical protein TWF192_000281 [Orbilia oligospora]|uniref:Peptidase S8/S53 domain-containing protein n=1 Tax=Orbilia oligospora TaxID=2813651 RepID=A0A6G1MNZ2_ORBOL|nr:hypothetical protein TWF679_009016 [Orbilia oligospora]KAF3265637.1 hypothetical protein TWF192_000281 [Orbilia oligospora]
MGPSHDPIDPHWCRKTGTSIATALVAGCAAVLIQAFRHKHDYQPPAALVKAFIINGATKVPPTSPPPHDRNRSGFGAVNLPNSIGIICGDARTGFMNGRLRDDHMKWTGKITAAPEVQYTVLKFTLVWSEQEGTELHNLLYLKLTHRGMGDSRNSNDHNNVLQISWELEQSETPFWEVDYVIRVQGGQLFTKSSGLSKQPFSVTWRLSNPKNSNPST